MPPTDQIQDLFDRALSSVSPGAEHTPQALHRRLNRRRLRLRISTLGGVLALTVSATALVTGLATNSAFAVTLFPGTTGSVAAAQLSADRLVMTARLQAVGFSSAVVKVEHGTLVITNGPKDLAKPSSYLTASPELLIRSAICISRAQSGPVSTDPLPTTCSRPRYAVPTTTPFGNSSTGFANRNVPPDPALSAYATTTPAQDAASPNAYALLPILKSNTSSVIQRYLVGPTLLTLSSKVASATVVPAPVAGGWMVNVRLNPSESRLWDQVAKSNFHRLLAIDLNGVIDEAPLIQPGSTAFHSFDGQMQLIASTKSGAYDLAAAFTTGPLPVPLVVHKFQNQGLPNASIVAAAQRLSSVLTNRFPNEYAGITLSNNNSTINVYVTTSALGLTSEVRELTPKGSANFITVVNSWRSLLVVHRQVARALRQLKSRGIDIAVFGPDTVSNREDIEVVDLTPAKTAILERKFGATKIQLEGIAANQVPVPVGSTW
jgi:hypothetical protein